MSKKMVFIIIAILTMTVGISAYLNSDYVLDDDNIYLAYMMDGEPLKSREDGGSGPYQIIIRKDQFSQRWAKYVLEIELQ